MQDEHDHSPIEGDRADRALIEQAAAQLCRARCGPRRTRAAPVGPRRRATGAGFHGCADANQGRRAAYGTVPGTIVRRAPSRLRSAPGQ